MASAVPPVKACFIATLANTSATTLSISGHAAKAVVTGVSTALTANTILAGQYVCVTYSAANDNFQMQTSVGGGGGGTGDVVGPASALDNEVVVFDSTTGKLVKRGTGCTLASSTITCTGGFIAGDGTKTSGSVFSELTANGSNYSALFARDSLAADSCYFLPSAVGSSGQVLSDSGTTAVTTETVPKTCRILSWVASGSGGLDLSTTGHCFFLDGCVYPAASISTFATNANVTYMVQVIIPATVKRGAAKIYVYDGGTSVQAAAFGIYANSSDAPGVQLQAFRLVGWNASGYFSVTLDAATQSAGVFWLAWAAEVNTLRTVTRVAGDSFLGNNGPRMVSCSNPVQGAGATYALPTTCGTASAEGNVTAPIVMLVP
jgi:hypothetical protein